MDPINAKTDTGAVIDALQSIFNTETFTVDQDGRKAAVLVTPRDRTIHSVKKFLDEYLPCPERRRGTAKAFDLLSLIALIERFSTEASVVFADPDKNAPTITAVFDYHPANDAFGDTKTQPTDWLTHRAVYAPQLSEEWKAWLEFDGEYLDLTNFAQFIEDHMTQLVVANLDDPTLKLHSELAEGRFAAPTDLIRLSRGIEISASIAVKQAVRLQSGEISVQYAEVHNDGSGEPLKIPSLFQINVPVFEAGAYVRVIARLRYRRAGSGLAWGYQLIEPEKALKGAFVEMLSAIFRETGKAVLLGAPET